MIRLESERLVLRPFVAGDFDALFAMQSRPDVARWLYWEPRNEDQVRAVLVQRTASTSLRRDGDSVNFAVVLKETSEVIGDGGLILRSAEHRQGEIGLIFHPDHQGRGYATEVGRLLLELAFDEFHLHRVVGRLEPRNETSARVLERLGMRREAHFRENEFVKGDWQSEFVYAILASEWAAAR